MPSVRHPRHRTSTYHQRLWVPRFTPHTASGSFVGYACCLRAKPDTTFSLTISGLPLSDPSDWPNTSSYFSSILDAGGDVVESHGYLVVVQVQATVFGGTRLGIKRTGHWEENTTLTVCKWCPCRTHVVDFKHIGLTASTFILAVPLPASSLQSLRTLAELRPLFAGLQVRNRGMHIGLRSCWTAGTCTLERLHLPFLHLPFLHLAALVSSVCQLFAIYIAQTLIFPLFRYFGSWSQFWF